MKHLVFEEKSSARYQVARNSKTGKYVVVDVDHDLVVGEYKAEQAAYTSACDMEYKFGRWGM